MEKITPITKWISTAIMAAGAVLLILTMVLDSQVNIALPVVFLMIGAAFYLLTFYFSRKWPWAYAIFIPGSIFIALGLIFFFNVVTNDWNSWAYAWLLIVAGAGFGLLLASRWGGWGEEYTLSGAGMLIVGITFFAVFGAIAGGPVIRITAPILVVLGGLSLRWVKLEKILPEQILKRWHPSDPLEKPAHGAPIKQDSMVEALSSRELEVLRLIDQGYSNQQIAEVLTLAPSTVKTHINNMYGKLGVQTRVQALNRARELNLIPPSRGSSA